MNLNDFFITKIDKKIIEKTGYGAYRGFGKKPSLIVIDAQKKFIGIDKPILKSIEIFPMSIGEKAYRALEKIEIILKKCRQKEVPIFYTTSGVPNEEMPFNSFAKKRKKYEFAKEKRKDLEEIPKIIEPKGEKEWIVHKRYASGFFGTPLISFLNTLNCDTLIVTGFVTSGCVRAFVVDAASYNFNVVVAEDAVADRFDFAHRSSLIDMHLKYTDVIPTFKVTKYLDSL